LLDEIDQTEKDVQDLRGDMFNSVMKDATEHMNAEEAVFYPALKSEIPDIVMKSIEAHNIARVSLDDLTSTPKSDPRFVAKLQVFRDIVLSHIEEEEGTVFDIAARVLGTDDLQDLGQRFEDAKGVTASRTSAAKASALGAGSGKGSC
jgi:hemerythrin superfamily protein